MSVAGVPGVALTLALVLALLCLLRFDCSAGAGTGGLLCYCTGMLATHNC